MQKVEKTIRIARKSWQWYFTLGFTLFTTLLFIAMTFWQEGRIEQCRISDIKYHYIMMHNGINSVGLDSIESWFWNPYKVKIIESKDPTFSTAVAALTSTGGTLNLPDNVLLLCYVTNNKGNDFLIEHLSHFIRFLMKLGRMHQIQHLAIAFSKDTDDFPNAVKSADVTCIRLY